MRNQDAFSAYHPVINFLYFGFVLIFSMIFMHPACLGISLVCAMVYSIYLNGKKAVRFQLTYMIPMFLVAAIMNPAFSHEGGTILTYLPSGNPLTLESIVYGIAAATMLISVITWFSCYNVIMTSDKFVYLFGRVIPAMSLLLSMTLRFVPKFKAQIKVVSDTQKYVGRDPAKGNVVTRARKGITILSVMITWALENAIETADSMKSRGYGLRGRTAFSIYQFHKRDRMALIFIIFCGAYIAIGASLGGANWRYFPVMKGVMSVYPMTIFVIYFMLCMMPVILNLLEDRKWKYLQLKT